MSNTGVHHEPGTLGPNPQLRIIPNSMPSITHDDELIYCHWHGNMEFILFSGGSAVMTVDSRRYPVSDGDMITINPGEVHTAHADPESGVVAHAVVFNPGLMDFREPDTCHETLVAPLREGRLLLPTHVTMDTPGHAPVLREARELVDSYVSGVPGREFLTRASICKIIALLYANGLLETARASEPLGKRDRTILLKGVIRHMEENLSADLRVGQLAAMADLSEDHFYKAFKALTGKTPVGYIHGLRIARAIRLMDKGMCVTEAALEVGFGNISYFIRVFRRMTGWTPARYMARSRA